ncbi:hypothetical protein AAFF_G00259030 [Aldrovandia affinis]|uniref:Uncharacterized protein n=1 Tax=Aldrovandia affinis TaxID=143900 RepID=A0AAD7STD2_9TELE|nr:hypothetical protein AAFF_G00259030 [Aldrovandia affinis]
MLTDDSSVLLFFYEDQLSLTVSMKDDIVEDDNSYQVDLLVDLSAHMETITDLQNATDFTLCKKKAPLIDAPVDPTGACGEAIKAMADTFQVARKDSVGLRDMNP